MDKKEMLSYFIVGFILAVVILHITYRHNPLKMRSDIDRLINKVEGVNKIK